LPRAPLSSCALATDRAPWHNGGMEKQLASHGAVDELAVSRAWQAGWFRADALRTTDGQPLTVVYRGRWTFGFGHVMASSRPPQRSCGTSGFSPLFPVCPGQ